MQLPTEILEQITFITRPQIELHILFIMEKSTDGEHLSQLLKNNNKQFIIAVTFLTGHNGIFIGTNSFTRSINDDNFSVFALPHGAYEIESLNVGIMRIVFDGEHFTEKNTHWL